MRGWHILSHHCKDFEIESQTVAVPLSWLTSQRTQLAVLGGNSVSSRHVHASQMLVYQRNLYHWSLEFTFHMKLTGRVGVKVHTVQSIYISTVSVFKCHKQLIIS